MATRFCSRRGGTFILNPLLYASVQYAMNELAPLSLIATTPHVFAVNGKVQARSVREFVASAKANPGKMTFGSTGSGSIQRLAFELFSSLTGTERLHVPYRAAETVTALVAGDRRNDQWSRYGVAARRTERSSSFGNHHQAAV